MAAASIILGGIMLAWRRRRMAEEDVDSSSLEEYVPEMEHLGEDLLEGNVLEMETDQTTLLQNLKDENDELQGQNKEMGRKVEMNKKLQNEQVKELKNEAEKTKLESECVQKELQKKKLENLLESLKKEKQSGNKWKREFEELKEEKEKIEANLVQDYEKLEFVCKIKDLEIMEQKMIAEKFESENKEIKKAQNDVNGKVSPQRIGTSFGALEAFICLSEGGGPRAPRPFTPEPKVFNSSAPPHSIGLRASNRDLFRVKDLPGHPHHTPSQIHPHASSFCEPASSSTLGINRIFILTWHPTQAFLKAG
ncbi:uncharacterized protein PF3D7_1120000-like [Palaemon carinicauda]|uniref:uncharacterized protein PF3D7_1120000-like n=1 Tax=Palaemon carinicauda TaxID=392227 RepID=UPI0035B6256D